MSLKKSANPAFDSAHRYHEYAQKYPVYKEAIRRLINEPKEHDLDNPKQIVDVGCGTGVSVRALNQAFPNANIAGIDKSSEMLYIAKSQVQEKITFECGASEDVLENKRLVSVDAIFCNASYWYLDSERLLPAVRKVLRPKGILVFIFLSQQLTLKMVNMMIDFCRQWLKFSMIAALFFIDLLKTRLAA